MPVAAPMILPPEAFLSLAAGLALLFISNFTLTFSGVGALFVRLALAPPALLYFWDFAYGPYDPSPGVKGPWRQATLALSTIGLYGVMRVIETAFVGALDKQPPCWVTMDGKPMVMPKSIASRLFYAFDLTTSLRGTSWSSDRHWEWAPTALRRAQPSSRLRFVGKAVVMLLLRYLAFDAVDVLVKSESWSTRARYPVTDNALPISKQLLFSFAASFVSLLNITLAYGVLSTLAVLCGASPASWPPMFSSPFAAASLADFWTWRWHNMFRRVFDRLSLLFLAPFSSPDATQSLKSPVRRWARIIVVFVLSTIYHLFIMARLDRTNPHALSERTLIDVSILSFFLVQPLGLFIEVFVIMPIATTWFGPEKVKIVTRVWAWMFLLWMGRYWADVWVRKGLWAQDEKTVQFSPIRGVLRGEWNI